MNLKENEPLKDSEKLYQYVHACYMKNKENYLFIDEIHTIVGAGAVVVKDLPERCTAVGTPAVPIKYSK